MVDPRDAGALGPCHECGRPLPDGTERYCVHCGAEVGGGHGEPVDTPRPRSSSWSSGDYRAPAPTDVEELPDPGVVPAWYQNLIRTGGDTLPAPPPPPLPGANLPTLPTPIQPAPVEPVQTVEPRYPEPLHPAQYAPPAPPVAPAFAYEPIPPGGRASGATGFGGTDLFEPVVPSTGPAGSGPVPRDPAALPLPAWPPGGAASAGPASARSVVAGVPAVPPPPSGPGPVRLEIAYPPDPADQPVPAGRYEPPRPLPMSRPAAPAGFDAEVRPAVPYRGEPGSTRSRPIAAVAIVAVILAVVAGGTLWWFLSRGSDKVTATNPVSVPAEVASGAGATGAVSSSAAAADVTPSASGPAGAGTASGSPTGSMAPLQVAQAIDDLLDRSATARSSVSATALALQSCRITPAKAAEAFRAASQLRTSLSAQATALNVTGLTGADQAVAAFVSMQKSSTQADDAFAAWADEVATSGCTGTAPHTHNLDLGNQYSGDASAAKTRFVTVWNPIARSNGLSPRSVDGI